MLQIARDRRHPRKAATGPTGSAAAALIERIRYADNTIDFTIVLAIYYA
jgi:hypothetical protein